MWREMVILVAHCNGQCFDLLCIWSEPNKFLEYSGEMKFEYMHLSFTVLVTQLTHKVFGKGWCFGSYNIFKLVYI